MTREPDRSSADTRPGGGHKASPGIGADAPPAAPASPATRAVRAGIGSDPTHRSVMPPIHLSTNYLFDAPGVCGPYDYSRTANPTRDLAARAIADLESGCGAVVTSSGMSAIAVVTRLLSPGDLLLAPADCYGGSYRLFSAEARRGQYRVEFVESWTAGALARARKSKPQMIWIETPSNPLLRISDIAAWSACARETGAICVADNTFLSPVNQRPLEHGADLVVHSTTKFLNGHSDVVGGAVVAAGVKLLEEVAWWANATGACGSAFDAYLTLRGIRTLHARSRVHEENAGRVVAALAGSEAVAAVHYPGLPGHRGHEIARRQQRVAEGEGGQRQGGERGHGGEWGTGSGGSAWGSLISFDLKGGRAAADAFCDGLKHFALAESLGGVESLVTHPWTMTHAAMDEAARVAAGIGEGLLRLSVGIEAANDLVTDVAAGLGRAGAAGGA